MPSRPERDWGRLNLVPRLRTDETLSSWLERFASVYALTVREFAEWLGYRPLHSVYALWRIDLDASPPADFVARLSQLTGLSAQTIDAHRIPSSGAFITTAASCILFPVLGRGGPLPTA